MWHPKLRVARGATLWPSAPHTWVGVAVSRFHVLHRPRPRVYTRHEPVPCAFRRRPGAMAHAVAVWRRAHATRFHGESHLGRVTLGAFEDDGRDRSGSRLGASMGSHSATARARRRRRPSRYFWIGATTTALSVGFGAAAVDGEPLGRIAGAPGRVLWTA
jgi:hypothetical protein